MGASSRGKKFSRLHKKRIGQSKLSENNPMWKGDKVGYNALHSWVKRRLQKPERCSSCRKVKLLDLANISQKYLRDIGDWEWLCRSCHMQKDGRLIKSRERLKKFFEDFREYRKTLNI